MAEAAKDEAVAAMLPVTVTLPIPVRLSDELPTTKALPLPFCTDQIIGNPTGEVSAMSAMLLPTVSALIEVMVRAVGVRPNFPDNWHLQRWWLSIEKYLRLAELNCYH